MTTVIAHAAGGMDPLPSRMAPIGASPDESDRNRRRVLLAHEALASLNDRNREEFLRLIEYVRKELSPPGSCE